MNDDRQEGPRRGRVPRAPTPPGKQRVRSDDREAHAGEPEMPDAAFAEPARSICEAVQRLVRADKVDAVGPGADGMRRGR